LFGKKLKTMRPRFVVMTATSSPFLGPATPDAVSFCAGCGFTAVSCVVVVVVLEVEEAGVPAVVVVVVVAAGVPLLPVAGAEAFAFVAAGCASLEQPVADRDMASPNRIGGRSRMSVL
jgi:hypothetical protein